MDIAQQLLQIISDPTIAYILLSLGLLGIFLELAHPGSFLPGTLGGICVIVGLASLASIHASWLGIGLMAFGFVLLTIDLYASGHGIVALAGLASFALGSYVVAASAVHLGLRVSPIAILATTATFGIAGGMVLGLAARSRHRRPQTGRERLIGTVGVARELLDPEGYVFVDGELWQAESLAGPIEPGKPVRVVGLAGLRVSVMPAESDRMRLGAMSGR